MQIQPTGEFGICRWTNHGSGVTIRDQHPIEFFRQGMSSARQDMLEGRARSECRECQAMEAHQKVSGRQRQMIKAGMWPQDIQASVRSTPWWEEFAHSHDNQGRARGAPQDWQIELGNYCNSACLFCRPDYSSRVAAEHRKLGMIQAMPKSWSDDPELVERFATMLADSASLRYLHFIGGEPLIMPAFGEILARIGEQARHHQTHIGFTTNLTVWPQRIINLLTQFEFVHVNVSIESLTSLNDYVRWPSSIDTVLEHMDRWLELCVEKSWWFTIRVTPTFLTVHDLRHMYEFAWQRGVPIEACNFLERPDFMRPTVLPWEIRQHIAQDLEDWCDQRQQHATEPIYNTRHPNFVAQHLWEDARSYCAYLRDQPDQSHRLRDLATYLRRVDQHRGNSVMDYLPQYADLFRTAGY
jgi:sulfatase maturation enzyme AslB (radical SAM superfamily)